MSEPFAPPPSVTPGRRRTPVALFIAIGVVLLLAATALVLWQTGALYTIFPGLAPETPSVAGRTDRDDTPSTEARPGLVPGATEVARPIQPPPPPDSLSTAAVLPAQTDLYLWINADIERQPGYQHLLAIYGQLPEFAALGDDLWGELEAETGFSFEKDIRPWLGDEVGIGLFNVAAALGPYSYDEEPPNPNVIIVLPSRDNRAADDFLDRLRDYLEKEEGYEIAAVQYQGVTYYVPQPLDAWDEPPIWGRANDHVLVTTDEDTMQEAIAAVQGQGATLAQNEAYQRALQTLPQDAVIYAVYPEFGDVLPQLLAESDTPLPEEIGDQIEALQSLGMAIRLDNEGVQMDMVVTFDPQKLSAEARALMQAHRGDERVLEYIPANALAFYSAYDLGALWANIFATLEQDRDTAQQMQDLGAGLGLTIDADLFKWMSGGFAVVVIEGDLMGVVPASGYAVAGVSDLKAAERTLGQIANAIVMMGGVEFKAQRVNGVEMQVAWDDYSGEIVLGYGFKDQFLLLALGEEAMNVATKPGATMAQDRTFQRVRAHLPQGNGYLYINVAATIEFALGQMSDWEREDFEQEALPYLAPIKAIGLAGEVDARSGVMRTTLFVYIP